ncbi:hypothetical protein D9756_004361 [Leucocoprinus leucothites]|uniref:Uncharacterized protein n=1 Tax=Leucocoprinus leucothites TaxID=201217 RepID=A0A8H5D9Y8_9AGAR|nr:hypothetical protein D9756_004361 [Leucoagaricus leucothites]
MGAHPFTLAEFGQLVSAALESESQGQSSPEPLTTASSRRSFLSFSSPTSRRPGWATSSSCQSLSPSPKSFFSFSQNHRMLHHPVPVRPMDVMSHIDLSHACMPLYPHHGPATPSSRPRARKVIEKLKRQASALVKSPSRRLRSHSCANPDQLEQTLEIPTVTFVSASPVEPSFTSRTRSVSCSFDDDDHSPAVFHIDAPAAGDFAPYLPLASRLEREFSVPYATEALAFGSRPSSASTPPPLSGAVMGRPVIPPPSPSPSERSDSTSSTRSPVTPVFSSYNDVHPYASPAAIPQRWSVGSDEQEQNNDPFAKGKVQIVRRSLIQDNFLMACAAVDDSQQGAASVEDNSNGGRSPKAKRSSVFRKKSNASLPPVKPPPSCPLPRPPPTASSESSVSIHSVLEYSRPPSPVVDDEWTLFLGAPSKPLEVFKGESRKRSGSSPAPSPSSKQHLSPSDIPPQVQQERQPRVRTISNMSTRSNATGRRIESGPAPGPDGVESNVFEDWTLSLPVLRKPKSTLSIEVAPVEPGPPVEARTRKCKSFTDWTMDLSDPYEKQEVRLREKERELERERKISRVSATSVTSAKGSLRSPTAKRLPIGPGPSRSQTQTHPLRNAGSKSLDRGVSTSMTSLRSVASSNGSSSASSYKDSLPFDPCSPDIAPVSPIAPSFSNHSAYADSIFIIPSARPPSLASTPVSTPSIANFPLPPSFSSKLSQRRSAAPPLPRPLRPTGAYKPLARSGTIYAEASHASTSTALPTIPSLSVADLDAHVASSAPATSLHFPPSSFPVGSLKKFEERRPDSYYYRPTTSSSVDSENSVATTSSTISAASSKSSVRTASSASTIVPRARTPRLMVNLSVDVDTQQQVDREPSSSLDLDADVEGARMVRPSFESSGGATEYDTCNEDGFSDECASPRRRRSPVEDDDHSECFYSARSSLNL